MITFVGAWVRFPLVKSHELVFIHSQGGGARQGQNAVWLPSMSGCSVSVGATLSNGEVVSETEVTDEMWAALAAWRLR